jgi:hypothetical protein
MSPTGGCLRPPVGAYLGQLGFVWYFCDKRDHEDEVNLLACTYADTKEFPLTRVPIAELPVYEVMLA